MKDIFFIAILFLMACSDKKEPEAAEEMKGEEVNDTSTVNNSDGKDTNSFSDEEGFEKMTIDSKLPFDEKVEKWLEKYNFLYSETEGNKMIVPERYGNIFFKKTFFKRKGPIKNKKDEDVFPEIQFYFFQYKDSTECRNVMNNWLQCYGTDCTPIEWMKDVEVVKSKPLFTIITKTEIIVMQTLTDFDKLDWLNIKRDLEQVFTKKGAYLTIEIPLNGKKLTWESFYKQEI